MHVSGSATYPRPVMNTTSTNPNQSSPLRRAAYVRVADLMIPYRIDPQRLEDELVRVRLTPKEKSDIDSLVTSSTDLDTTSPTTKRLQPPRGGFNLCVLVGRVEIVVDKNRVDGSRVRLAEVEVGDETGCVSLRARDDQIDVLQQVSERAGAVVLRNCTLELYQGRHIRLAVTKWGKLSTYPDQVPSTPSPPRTIHGERNFSLLDLKGLANSDAAPPAEQPEIEKRQPSPQESQQHVSTRTQPFSQSNPNQPRRNRRVPRGKPGMQPTGGPLHTRVNYSDTFPTGMHGYGTGFVDTSMMDPQRFSYNLRQQERHHMMIQQHHQYPIPHPMFPQQQDRGINTGSPFAGMVPADSQPYSTPMAMQFRGPHSSGGYIQPDSSHDSSPSQPSAPSTPKMNARAATYDPSRIPKST